ncbi:SAM-dependent methyltransferase [Dokdonia pacifica]|uniref:Thiopurine S-methyltransferase (TPMT) n=1 Tax=Dokdonia pacifica TaxID=1627892 RepID=A0A239E3U2_9FLAO|nr:methyltransferase domain-containing protein [Dokdonia pacifica]GGG24387.1 SAM-dependent methyltransferase [Dokdonia pacifica]SNS38632.1 Thiopurine S-methyltransferase (TPMT) [Dokdonia pacifica]
MEFNGDYWENRYQENTARWDLGNISTPIKEYIDQLENKDLKIIIPGGGNSHEAEYLFNSGFKNVYVIDIATSPLQNIQRRIPSFPKEHLIQADFFSLDMTFDLVIEQTFFCALSPTLRPAYVKKMHAILVPNGKIVGLLFGVPLYENHPPFGGNKKEYKELFKPYFDIKVMETATNSVESRAGRELFINMHKK